MKSQWLLGLTLLLALAGGAVAQSPTATTPADPNGNLIGLKTANGRLVYDFINLWFNEHQAAAAWDKYVARHGYMNHAVYNATTKTVNHTFAEEKAEEARAAGPHTVFKIKQLIAQGNLVFVHIAASHGEGGEGAATGVPSAAPPPPAAAAASAPGPGGPGPQGDGKGDDEMVMILRVHHGKIVDHWDLHVPTNSDSVVFEGLDRPLP
jgi:predicted SnoaL-like aldol condensation-catalyzing enzyme